MTLTDLLDIAKDRTGSDAKTADKMGLTKASLSQVRSGTRALPIDAAVELAKLTREDWSTVVAAAEAHRREKRGDREGASRWATRAHKKTAGTIMAALMMIFLCMLPDVANAQQINRLEGVCHTIHYR